MNTNWMELTQEKLAEVWVGFLTFLPQLIIAILVFIIGWFIAILIGRIVAEILKKLRFNQIFEAGVWKEALEKAEFKVDASGFVGAIIKWVLVIVALWIALGLLGESFAPFTQFLEDVLNYLPNVVIAAFIFVVAVIVADLLGKVLRVAVESTRVGYGHIVEVIVKWAIMIFAIWAILIQLEIASELLMTIFQGLIALIVIAGGIAFGLGGKSAAEEILGNLHRKLKG